VKELVRKRRKRTVKTRRPQGPLVVKSFLLFTGFNPIKGEQEKTSVPPRVRRAGGEICSGAGAPGREERNPRSDSVPFPESRSPSLIKRKKAQEEKDEEGNEPRRQVLGFPSLSLPAFCFLDVNKRPRPKGE